MLIVPSLRKRASLLILAVVVVCVPWWIGIWTIGNWIWDHFN